jgi:hypothetical protein
VPEMRRFPKNRNECLEIHNAGRIMVAIEAPLLPWVNERGSAGVARRLGFGREAWRGRDIGLERQPACAGRGSRGSRSGACRRRGTLGRGRRGRLGGSSAAGGRHAAASGRCLRVGGSTCAREQREEGGAARERESGAAAA